MSRPIKNGLDYFPLNVDFFDDDKIAFVSVKFEEKGELTALKLLCKIYKDTGYYYQWGEDEALLFAKRLLGDASQYTFVNKVVEELVKRNFFDKDIFEKYKILTSHGIQERYDKICKDSKRIYTIDEKINLLGENSPFTPEKPGVNRGKSTQRKVNKIKGKEINELSSPPIVEIEESLHFPFNSLQFNDAWTGLLKLPKWKKKPADSLQKSLDKLKNFDELFAIELINRAIEGNYQGLVFDSTDDAYLKWKTRKKGHAMASHLQNTVHDDRF